MEWTKSATLKFIELLQGHPCLWNIKSVEYKNRLKRRDALSQLANEMSMDVGTVEKKIISLKSQYNRELSKMKSKSGAGLADVIESSWYAFKHLHFLKDINMPLPSTDSIMVTQTENEEEAAELPETTQDSQSGRILSQTKHGSQDTLNLLKNASNAIINRQKKDEFSTFGEYIASELREIKSKKHLLKLKKNIMDLVYKTKLEILDSESVVSDKENTLLEPVDSVVQEVEVEGHTEELIEDTQTITETAFFYSNI